MNEYVRIYRFVSPIILRAAFVSLAFCIGLWALLAQNRNTEPVQIKEAFIKGFNSASSEEFRTFFNDGMKRRNSVHKLNNKFRRTRDYLGEINSMQFDRSSFSSYFYRSNHKMATLEVQFDLDSKGQLSEMSFGQFDRKDGPKLKRNSSELILPFHGKWYVYWGGSTISENYHNTSSNTRGAFDFSGWGENRKSYRTNGKVNEDYYAFGKEIIAPTAGKIIFVRDGIRDNVWPATNKEDAAGNIVLLESNRKEYLVFAHLKLNSIQVKKGQIVKQGDLLGSCGNSGLSTEPHLHFQIQNLPDLVSPIGARAFFKKIKVNGEVLEDYSPVKTDVISN